MELLHGGSTQKNDGVNNGSNTKAPKTRVYCSTSSLKDFISTIVGLHNFGHVNYHAILFNLLGVVFLPSMYAYLQAYQI
eukprot:15152267-Ditylum_brightwellii.AAC.1